MSFWSKAKGVFSRIGRGIKNAAHSAYNWITNNKDKIQKVAGVIGDVTKHKYDDKMSKIGDLYDKGVDYGHRLGII